MWSLCQHFLAKQKQNRLAVWNLEQKHLIGASNLSCMFFLHGNHTLAVTNRLRVQNGSHKHEYYIHMYHFTVVSKWNNPSRKQHIYLNNKGFLPFQSALLIFSMDPFSGSYYLYSSSTSPISLVAWKTNSMHQAK